MATREEAVEEFNRGTKFDLSDNWMEKKTVLFVTHDISEAVFLSDRILVMIHRSGTVKKVIDIDIPRPRQMETKESIKFNQYVGLARRLMHSSE